VQKISPPLEFNPRTVQPVSSRYTNYTIPAYIGLTRNYLYFGCRYSSKYNCLFNDAETHAAVLYEMQLYKQFGGGAIVENSNHGLQRNVKFMQEVSQRTGVHVIAGTGMNDADS
jgi:predicted metal-dependent phosphotriesterase family hydrolase